LRTGNIIGTGSTYGTGTYNSYFHKRLFRMRNF
jgi:hypothetical protein